MNDTGGVRNGIEWKDVSSIELGPRHDANVFISAELVRLGYHVEVYGDPIEAEWGASATTGVW